VLFIDKPAPDQPVGIWGVSPDRPQDAPELFTERIAFYSGDMQLVMRLEGNTTILERLADPRTGEVVESWTVPAGGRPVSFSPSRRYIAWQVSNDNVPFEQRVTEVWVANLDGSDARRVVTLPLGGLEAWISDDTWLVSGRESLQAQESILYKLSLADGEMTELARARRLRGETLSPDGRWLAYYMTFGENPEENGMWLMRTADGQQQQLDRALFGAYQWRDAGRLLVVPFRPDATYHELWEVDVETGQARRLTDPAVTPFKIANGDWDVSPDGQHVAFVSAEDRNIWVLGLVK
jgi:Tol biopolymer transport system component